MKFTGRLAWKNKNKANSSKRCQTRPISVVQLEAKNSFQLFNTVKDLSIRCQTRNIHGVRGSTPHDLKLLFAALQEIVSTIRLLQCCNVANVYSGRSFQSSRDKGPKQEVNVVSWTATKCCECFRPPLAHSSSRVYWQISEGFRWLCCCNPHISDTSFEPFSLISGSGYT